MENSPKILEHTPDNYGGVIIDSEQLPASDVEFTASLVASVSAWQEQGKRCLWLKIPREKAMLIGHAVEQSFEFHHAESAYVMLTRWLSEEPSTVPANASHQIGVGAIVLNSKNEILLVQERRGPAARPGFWKVPTGLVEQGEEIHDAAVREVLEECGIQSEFLSLISFRSVHKIGMAGKSDLFFICALRPITEDIVVQESELTDAKWMSVDEWLSLDYMKESLYKSMYEWGLQYFKGTYTGFTVSEMPIGFRPGTNCVYHLGPHEASKI